MWSARRPTADHQGPTEAAGEERSPGAFRTGRKRGAASRRGCQWPRARGMRPARVGRVEPAGQRPALCPRWPKMRSASPRPRSRQRSANVCRGFPNARRAPRWCSLHSPTRTLMFRRRASLASSIARACLSHSGLATDQDQPSQSFLERANCFPVSFSITSTRPASGGR